MSLEWGPNEGKMTWDKAVALAKAKGGGWRLPTVAELVSQYDYDKDCPNDESWKSVSYWSSSPYFHDGAWSVSFNDGGVYRDERCAGGTTRCVRKAEAES